MSHVIFSPGVSKTFHLGLEHPLHQQALLRGLEQISPVLQGVPHSSVCTPSQHVSAMFYLLALMWIPQIRPWDHHSGEWTVSQHPVHFLAYQRSQWMPMSLLEDSFLPGQGGGSGVWVCIGITWALKQHRLRSAQTHYIHPLSPEDLFFQIPTLSPTSVLCGMLTWGQSPSFTRWLQEAAGPWTHWFFTTQVLVTAGWRQRPAPRNHGTHKLNLMVCFHL